MSQGHRYDYLPLLGFPGLPLALENNIAGGAVGGDASVTGDPTPPLEGTLGLFVPDGRIEGVAR